MLSRTLAVLLCLVSVQTRAQAVAPARPPRPAYVAPPELPHTPTGAGASRDRLVGPEKEVVPRSPNKRALPSSDEPGVWAADGDPALASIPPSKFPRIKGFLFPFPPGLDDNDKARGPTEFCASVVEGALPEGAESRLADLTEQDRMCLLHTLMKRCADLRAAKQTRDSVENARRARLAAHLALVLESRVCFGHLLSEEATALGRYALPSIEARSAP